MTGNQGRSANRLKKKQTLVFGRKSQSESRIQNKEAHSNSNRFESVLREKKNGIQDLSQTFSKLPTKSTSKVSTKLDLRKFLMNQEVNGAGKCQLSALEISDELSSGYQKTVNQSGFRTQLLKLDDKPPKSGSRRSNHTHSGKKGSKRWRQKMISMVNESNVQNKLELGIKICKEGREQLKDESDPILSNIFEFLSSVLSSSNEMNLSLIEQKSNFEDRISDLQVQIKMLKLIINSNQESERPTQSLQPYPQKSPQIA